MQEPQNTDNPGKLTSDSVSQVSELERCTIERDEYLAGWQRAKADLINAKREMEKEKEAFVKYSNAILLQDFLPLSDYFEQAFSHKESWEAVDKNWRTGVEQIYKELCRILRENGLESFGQDGDVFNPELHIGSGKDTEGDGGDLIKKVVAKGYKLNGKIIRPAKVII